jgi:DNA topoisomerase-3
VRREPAREILRAAAAPDRLSPTMRVLMVAEKPSIAQAVANALAQGSPVRKRKGVSPSAPVFEYEGYFMGAPAEMRCTSTVGHMWSLDFGREFNDQGKVQPVELFDAPTVHLEDPRPRMTEHLRAEAAGCDALVLWLDCDREGENICFEVIHTTSIYLNPTELPGAYDGNIFRARFSSLAPADLNVAFGALAHPNLNESRSVDARQLIDLKLGVAFSRFMTRFFRSHLPELGQTLPLYL